MTPSRWTGLIICHLKCWSCMFLQCPGGDHRWASDDDIEHAIKTGQPKTAEGRCGCPCAKGPVLEQEPDEEPPDYGPYEWSPDSPCVLCGEQGACSYDNEGRPLIHAIGPSDEDGT